MKKKNVSDTKEVLFTAKDLYKSLIKDVFNTYTLSDRWDTKPEEIGRTYFYDKKNAENPFDRLCCERIHTLYDAAFNDEISNISSFRVSQLLCKYLSEYFSDDLNFLAFYSGEDGDLCENKINALLKLLDKITDYAAEHNDFRLLDTYALTDDICDIKAALGVKKSPEEISEVREHEEYLREKVIKRTFLYNRNDLTQTMNMIDAINKAPLKNKGQIVYFLNSSIAGVQDFMEHYLKYTKINLSPLPTINYKIDESGIKDSDDRKYVTRAYWNYVVTSERFIPEFDKSLYSSAYDLDAIENSLKNEDKTYCIIGSSDNYERLIKHMNIDKLILLLPKDINNLFRQLTVKGYTSMDMAEIRLEEFKKNIDYCIGALYLNNQSHTGYYTICWDELSNDMDYIYYSGLMDGLIADESILNTMKTDFLKEYLNILRHYTE